MAPCAFTSDEMLVTSRRSRRDLLPGVRGEEYGAELTEVADDEVTLCRQLPTKTGRCERRVSGPLGSRTRVVGVQSKGKRRGRTRVSRMITAVGACFACLAVASSVEVGQAASPPRDRIPPSKPTIDGDRATGNLRPVFHFGARDNRTRPSQITFRCAIDSALLHPCARIYQPFSNLAFGPHVLRVRAKDRARNASRVATITFVVVGTWDAATDFPLARPENPAHDKYGNTTWFYLYGGVPVHDPMQYRALPEFHQLGPTNYQWNLGLRADGNVNTPLVGVGAPGILILHPDRDYFAVVGWRSPIAGKISVELQLRFPDPALQALSNGIALVARPRGHVIASRRPDSWQRGADVSDAGRKRRRHALRRDREQRRLRSRHHDRLVPRIRTRLQ